MYTTQCFLLLLLGLSYADLSSDLQIGSYMIVMYVCFGKDQLQTFCVLLVLPLVNKNDCY